MKTFFILSFFLLGNCSLVEIGSAQLLFEENFNYTAGDTLRAHGWTISGTSTVNPLSVTSPGLSYTAYASSGIGNATTLQNNGQDLYASFTPANSGSVYLSILANLSAAQATGDYFIALSASTSQTNYYARLHAKSSGAGYILGINKNNEVTGGSLYGTTVLNFNQTYLIVVKYAFIPTLTTDDSISVFVFADPILPSTEPGTPEVGPYANVTKADVADIGIVTLRQGSATAAPTLVIDGIRIGQSWNDAPLPIQLASFTGGYSQADNSVKLDWRTISEVNNYGFYVQRSNDRVAVSDVSSLIPGNGTTNVPHNYTFTDINVPNSNWFYRLKQVDLDGAVFYTEWITVVASPTSVSESAPKEFTLKQNYPNPFNPETHIKFSVEKTGRASLHVYDVVGREVALLYNDVAEAGKYYDVTFRGTNLTSGVYFYKLESGNNVSMKKLMLLK